MESISSQDQKEVCSYDELLLQLSKQIDLKSGESLFAIEQTKLLEVEFQQKRQQLVQNQLLMQGIMDIRQKLPQKIYVQIIQRIAKQANKRMLGGQEPNKKEQEDFKKLKNQIEDEVIPELEQYLHSISKNIKKILTDQNSQDDSSKPLNDLIKEYRNETKLLKESIVKRKAEKQKKVWEIQDLDIQIKDLVEKIGRGYMLNSVAQYQKEQVKQIETQLLETQIQDEESKNLFDHQFFNEDQMKAQLKVKQILEKRIQEMSLVKQQLHKRLINYGENEQEMKQLAQEYQYLQNRDKQLTEILGS
eukprot:403359022